MTVKTTTLILHLVFNRPWPPGANAARAASPCHNIAANASAASPPAIAGIAVHASDVHARPDATAIRPVGAPAKK